MMSDLSAHRRPLATAAAAAGLLFALGFVPSAQASPETVPGAGGTPASASLTSSGTRTTADAGMAAESRVREDAGTDLTPYVLGAVGLAGAGGLLATRTRHVCY